MKTKKNGYNTVFTQNDLVQIYKNQSAACIWKLSPNLLAIQNEVWG
jgi:hypothetical protein